MADYKQEGVNLHKRLAAGASADVTKAAGKPVQNAMKKGGLAKASAPMKKSGRGR